MIKLNIQQQKVNLRESFAITVFFLKKEKKKKRNKRKETKNTTFKNVNLNYPTWKVKVK